MVEHQQPTLAQVVEQHVYSPNAYLCSCSRDDDDAPTISFAEWAIHVEAVWRETCTITTVEQLLAVPVGCVIRTSTGGSLEKFSDTHWYPPGGSRALPANRWRGVLPARLIWHPDWRS